MLKSPQEYRQGPLIDKEGYFELMRGLDMDFSEYLSRNSISCTEQEAVITGGSALVFHGCLEKATLDIDFIELSSVLDKYLLQRQDKIFNSASQVFLYYFPEDFLDRSVPIDTGDTKIRFSLVSLEDLVVSKLPSYRDKDIADIRNTEVVRRLNLDLLDRLVGEKAQYAINKTAESILRAVYSEYRKDIKPISG